MASIPDVGDPAPDFTLPSTQGTIRLSARRKDRAVLLVFYPGDDTPVCTKQLCDYRDNLSVFVDLGVDVLGINPQAIDSHEAFAKKFSLPFPLVSPGRNRTEPDVSRPGQGGMVRLIQLQRIRVSNVDSMLRRCPITGPPST